MLKALGWRCSRISQFTRVWMPVVMLVGGCVIDPFRSNPAEGGGSVTDAGVNGDAGSSEEAGAVDASGSADASLDDACTGAIDPVDAGSSVDAAVPDDVDASVDAAGLDAETVLDGGSPVDAGEALSGWFVDSVNGSDSNDGRSARSAFATLTKLQAEPVASGEIVYLSRGSFWREELANLPAGSEVRTYGGGPRPIIDGSDVGPNAMFRKTEGFTNLYEIPWMHSFSADDGKSAHRVWENGTRLRRALDLAASDATPGSFFAATPTAGGPDIVFVHASDSSDISTNSRLYELTRRRWAVQLYKHRNHGFVYGLHTRRNSHADGSLAVDGLISDCVAEDGRIHNIFIRGIAEDSTAWKIEPPKEYGGATMFVTYEDVIDLPAVVYRNCRAIADGDALGPTGAPNDRVTLGFYGHTSRGVKFGTAIYEECATEGVTLAFSFSNVDNALYYKSRVKALQISVATNPSNTLAVLGGTYYNWGVNASLIRYNVSTDTPKNLIVRGVRVLQDAGYTAPIWIDRANTNVEISRNTFVQLGGGVFNFFNGSFVVKNNVFYGMNYEFHLGSTELSYVSDANVYFNTNALVGGSQFHIGLTPSPAIVGVPAWRDATGQDHTSIDADPLFVGSPAMGEFAFTPDSPIWFLGAGADFEGEQLDAELQAHRAAMLATVER